ncbi:MAG: polysaccharide deacetylase family protein [Anaerolineae bacterium]|nr:MAG: polysaccharide deacetylase family protein [Anaerolineae bacterium]
MYLQDTPPPHPGWKERLFDLALRSGLTPLGHSLWKNTLTVLNYHRVNDPDAPDFDTFKPNVSARPEAFARQMDYLKRWFNVVSLQRVIAWLEGREDLPPRAALITFDDGYRDNYTHAYPILRERGLPATIFLTTGHIESDRPFYWDLVAYCFTHTHRESVTLPNGKVRHWENAHERERVARAWIEAAKALPESAKQTWVERLPEQLGVAIPSGYFRRQMLTWEQIREMREGGIEFGAHSVTHPILTRIPLAQAKEEIETSKRHIEEETGEPVLAFAYPNGLRDDFSPPIERLVAEAGMHLAFTLLNGPCSRREVRRDPFAIRRIFISHRHTLPRFALLLTILNRYRH